MKKAQTIGQVFMFILAGLIFVLILVYGYKAITSLLERGEEVQMIDFRNALESTIKTIRRDYGSVQKVTLRVPPQTKEVCMASSSPEDMPEGKEQQFEQEMPLLYNAWATGSENIFLMPRQPTPLFLEGIIVDSGYECTPAADGRVVLRVEGTGSKAKISKWEQ
jgi:hypothetical protein